MEIDARNLIYFIILPAGDKNKTLGGMEDVPYAEIDHGVL